MIWKDGTIKGNSWRAILTVSAARSPHGRGNGSPPSRRRRTMPRRKG